jgi:hypothetical protein
MYRRFLWTPEIEEHLAEHGVTVDDYEYAFEHSFKFTTSRQSGQPAFFGRTADGRLLFGVYEALDDIEAIPLTAYPVD